MLILNLSFGEEHILAREFTYSLRTALFKILLSVVIKGRCVPVHRLYCVLQNIKV